MTQAHHPRLDLDDKLLNPLRLSLISALSSSEMVTFKELRDFLQTTDSTLSKHTSALEECGYVTVKKSFMGVRPQTSLAITARGYEAWKAHVAALQAIARSAG